MIESKFFRKFLLLSLLISGILILPVKGKASAAEGQIESISGREIQINMGKDKGLSAGKILPVMRIEEIKRGDVVLKVEKVDVGELEILEVGETTSKAKMVKSLRPAKQGDTVSLNQKLDPSAPAVVEVERKAAAKPPVKVEQPQQEKAAKPAAAAMKPAIVEVERKPTPAKPEPVKKQEPKQEAKQEVKQEAKVEKNSDTKEESTAPGILTLETEPKQAEIFIDGNSLGLSPKIIQEQAPGTYKVKASKKDFYTWNGQVVVKSGQNNKLRIEMKKFEGDLQINSMPQGADVKIDGEAFGKTDARVSLKPGKYKISLQKAGYNSIEKTVDLKAGSPVSLSLILEEKGSEAASAPTGGMVKIPGGSFTMGEGSNKRTVIVDTFYIDKYEVSNGEYKKFVDAAKHEPPAFWGDKDLNNVNQPVVGISWDDAAAYAKWAGKRLPTEAEWEKAARGFDSRAYPWGNNFDGARANKFGGEDGYKFTAPAQSFPNGASPYGVVNMAGNVWEWCADWFEGTENGKMKSLRGGAWDSYPDSLRASNRYCEKPRSWKNNIGFRCVK